MRPKRLTPKKRLRAMGDAFATMSNLCDSAPARDRKRLLKLAVSCSHTNCGWGEFGAAQHIIRRSHGVRY